MAHNRPIDNILARLEKVTPAGEGKWKACCPAHDDRSPSLAVGVGRDGAILVHCHAGCDVRDVVKAVGLRTADLRGNTAGGGNGRVPRPANRKVYPTIADAARAVLPDSVLVELYAYADGVSVGRFEPKDFRPFTRVDGGWICAGGGDSRPLYRWHEIENDAEPWIVEGEQDVESGRSVELPVTTWRGGANAVSKTDWRPLAGRHVRIIPDADPAGQRAADQIVSILLSMPNPAASVRIVRLPGEHKDLSDWLNDHDLQEASDLRRLLDEAAAIAPECERSAQHPATKDERPKKSQADRAVDLVDDLYLFHNDDDALAQLIVGDHAEIWPVRSKGFKQFLARQFYEAHAKVPSTQALQDALNVIAGRAIYSGPEHEVCLRVGAAGNSVSIDLADSEWRSVVVTGNGWHLVDSRSAGVRFIRRRGMLPLPEPKRGRSIRDLRKFLNVPDDDAWTLIVGWLLMTFHPTGPYPILALAGEQGSAKSTTSRFLRALVDPNRAMLRRPPRNEHDVMIAARNGWVISIDNLSALSPSISDCLCSLATGGGYATRQLYSDDDEKLFSGARPILINGIEDIIARPDLLDRSVQITLPQIDDADRRDEAKLLPQFEEARPYIFAALLDAVAQAIGNVQTVTLDTMPRMADFARWVTAAEPALGWKPGQFLAAYMGNRADANNLAIEASPVGPALQSLMDHRPSWDGTAGELLTDLEAAVDEKTTKRGDWPANPRALGGRLRRLAPNLRATGISVEFTDQRKRRGRVIQIEQTCKSSSPRSQQSPTQPDGTKTRIQAVMV